MRKIRLPFQNMSQESWINLAIAAAITFNIVQIGFFIFDDAICKDYGFDFCAFWSAGKVINGHSFVNVYDMTLLKEYQKEIYPYTPDENTIFYGAPVAYLPVFLLPFKILALLDIPLSYLIWTIFNFVGFILYLRFFTKKIFRDPLSWRLLLLFLLAFPVFANFREGQVNVILMIFTGEFLRALKEERPLISGLWLGGLLFKPQLLIVIIPFLLFKKSLKFLIGFFVSSISIIILSFILINLNGFLALKDLFFEFSEGHPTNNIAAMMNWRMLGWHISSISSSTIGWGVTILGTIITLGITLFFFREWDGEDQKQTPIVFLGILAATCAATWHSHLHMAVILIPPMAYLVLEKKFDQNLLTAWVFVPVFSKVIGIIIAYFLQIKDLYGESFQINALTTGMPSFILNLIILSWAITHFVISYNKSSQLITEEK